MPRTAAISAAMALAASASAASETFLLIPDTGADRIWAFSAFDGSVISNNYIPADGRMKQVMQVAQLPGGTLVMADPGTSQACAADDGVREYTPCGQYIRTIASSADGVCNPEGITVAYGKAWFVRLYDAASEPTPGRSALWSFNVDGTGLAEGCLNVGLDKPWGILPFQGGFLVSDSTDDNVEFVRLDCVPAAPFMDSDGATGPNFPQQVSLMADGSIGVASFSSPTTGLYFYGPDGTPLDVHNPLVAPRGIFQLGNGEILYTGGTAVRAFNPVKFTDRLIINQTGASFRWISAMRRCDGDLDCSGAVNGADLGVLLGGWGGAGAGDLNDDGTVDGADLGLLLSEWGGCSVNG
jgi:hypothetical protein